MRSQRDDAWALFLAIVFYSSYAWHQFHPPAIMTSFTLAFALTLASLAGLLFIFHRLPLDRWVYLVAALVPLEISGPRWILPSLSPIDYVCTAAMIDFLLRIEPKGLLRKGQEIFGPMGLAAWAAFYAFGIWDASHSGGSLRGLLRWGEFLFCFALAAAAAKTSPTMQKNLATLMTWIGALFSVVAICQFFAAHQDYTKTYATFRQHNGFGAYLSLCLPAAWGVAIIGSSRNRRLRIFAALLITTAFLLAYSRGAWLGIAASIPIAVLSYKSRYRSTSGRTRFAFISILFFSGISVLIPLAITRADPQMGVMHWTPGVPAYGPRMSSKSTHRLWTSAERPYYWRAAFSMLQNHPWLGIGPGRFESDLRNYLDKDAVTLYDYELTAKHRADFWSHLHSMYLQMAVQYGGIGFCLWSLALAALFARPVAMTTQSGTLLPACIQMTVIAFLIHNAVDILFVNSFDLVVAFMLASLL